MSDNLVASQAQPHVFTTLVDALHYWASIDAERSAFVFLRDGELQESILTYGQLKKEVTACAAKLVNAGLAGKVIVISYPPGLDFIISFFAIMSIGAIAVPAFPPSAARLHDAVSEKFRVILKDSKANAVLTASSLLESLKAKEEFSAAYNFAGLEWLALDYSDNKNDRVIGSVEKFSSLNPDSIAYLQYTSGSTSTPKGVTISHSNYMYNLQMIKKAAGTHNRSTIVSWLPLYHDMGLVCGVFQAVFDGFTAVLMSPADFMQRPVRWLKAISRYQATHAGAPNFAYDMCVNSVKHEELQMLDLSHWQVAFNGAEFVKKQTLDNFSEKFSLCGFEKKAFLPCYGLAEVVVGAAWCDKLSSPSVKYADRQALEQNRFVDSVADDANSVALVSSGYPRLEQQLIIVDNEKKAPCSEGHIGEIWISGKNVAGGYWGHVSPEAFHAQILNNNEQKFLKTGDVGFILDGLLYVTGRIKDMIIIGGKNHYSQDIEITAEAAHTALVINASAAFATSIENQERLVIVCEVKRSFVRKIDSDLVRRSVSQAIVSKHSIRPYDIVLVKPLCIPRTTSGKIRRNDCRGLYLANKLAIIE